MQTVIIVVHLFIVLALIGVVLLQRSEGGLGLGGGGGGGGVGGFLTGRGQANALTRATAILAALFFITSLTLGVIAHRGAAPRSIFDQNAPGGPPSASQPTGGQGEGILNELQRMQGPATPIAPSAPATPQVPQSR